MTVPSPPWTATPKPTPTWTPTPDRVAVSRMAAVLRGSATLVVVASALLGAEPPVPVAWLALVLTGYSAWSAVYARLGWVGRLTPWVAAADVAATALLFVPYTRLLPPQAAHDRFNWVTLSAGPVAVCLGACGRPWLAPFGGAVLAGSLVAASTAAGAPGGGVAQALIVLTQSVLSAVVFTIVGRAGAGARSAFAALRTAERAADIRRAERADELTQLRLLHNGALTTLTMAVHTDDRRPSALLRRRAAADLRSLPAFAPAGGVAAPTAVRLDRRIAQVVDECRPRLVVRYTADPVLVPGGIAEALASAVAEALENVARHAGTGVADVRVTGLDGSDGSGSPDRGLRVEVTDTGVGFTPDPSRRGGFGIREVVLGQLREVGGTAQVVSRPGHGTTVTLGWRRG